MPKVDWGISAGTVENWDRDSQFKPYRGPIPPNSVYLWHIKQLVFIASTEGKYPQLRIGLELKARTKEERRYQGYFVRVFRSITDNNPMFWVPFLDAIGVSERDFRQRTLADQDGNIRKIGSWGNNGKQFIEGQLRDNTGNDGVVRKDIGWMGAPNASTDAENDEDWEESEVEGDDSDDGEDDSDW